jgi:hypothetical protein
MKIKSQLCLNSSNNVYPGSPTYSSDKESKVVHNEILGLYQLPSES